MKFGANITSVKLLKAKFKEIAALENELKTSILEINYLKTECKLLKNKLLKQHENTGLSKN